MSQQAWLHVLWSCLAAAGWLAVYRLPLARPRTRQRFRLWVSSTTGMPPRLVFPIVGTVIYLVAAVAAAAAVMVASGPSLDVLAVRADWRILPVTVLAILGSAAMTAFAMLVAYTVRPTADIAGAVSTVEWISQVMVLPVQWRWIVPASSAAAEEFFFRGVLCGGLLFLGAPAWVAVLVSAVVFTVGQVLLTENRLQSMVLAVSSVVISGFGGLLVVTTGSVLPAIVMHASFAAFYTNTGGSASGRPAVPVR